MSINLKYLSECQWDIVARLDDKGMTDDICLLTHVGGDIEVLLNFMGPKDL